MTPQKARYDKHTSLNYIRPKVSTLARNVITVDVAVKGVSFNQQSKDIAHIKRYNAGEGLLNFRLRLGEYDP